MPSLHAALSAIAAAHTLIRRGCVRRHDARRLPACGSLRRALCGVSPVSLVFKTRQGLVTQGDSVWRTQLCDGSREASYDASSSVSAAARLIRQVTVSWRPLTDPHGVGDTPARLETPYECWDKIRAGLHTGECDVMGNKLGGIAVHIGARVAARAEPDEVLVSEHCAGLSVGVGHALY